MSAKQTGLVWELDLPRPEKYVLSVLADHAKDDGRDVYPSLARIEWKTGYGETQVRAIMRTLERRGVLVLEQKGGRGAGSTDRYRLDLSKAPRLQEFKEWLKQKKAKGAKTEPIPEQQAGVSEVSTEDEQGCGNRTHNKDGKGSLSGQEGSSFGQIRVHSTEPEPKANHPSRSLASSAELAQPPDRGKPAKEKTTDPRHQVVVDAIRRCWPAGVPFAFDGADGAALRRLLNGKAKSVSGEQLAIWVAYRFLSEGINESESVKSWIGALWDYASGPLNQFGDSLARSPQVREVWLERAKQKLAADSKPDAITDFPALSRIAPAPPSTPESERLTKILHGFFRERLKRQTFNTWIEPTKIIEHNTAGLVLAVPSQEFLEIIERFEHELADFGVIYGCELRLKTWDELAMEAVPA